MYKKNWFKYYARWILIAAVVGVFCGVASAVFLITLEEATLYREAHPWLIWCLPLGGFAVGWLYHRFGRDVEGGNNLIIEEFHEPNAVIPLRMAPLVLAATVLTHLFGGSAGREGTAVQMGGSLADQLGRPLRLSPRERRVLLMTGMSGGFGSVFGVPFAGMVFGMEVLAIGRVHIWAVVECAIAAVVAHHVCLAVGAHHTVYPSPFIPDFSLSTAVLIATAGACFGLAARFFASLTHAIGRLFKHLVKFPPLRPLIGGALVAAAFHLLGTTRYAGLGVPVIVESIRAPVHLYDWIGKLFFTALTLGAGFKGGEVTPLLYVGSTLGNALAPHLALPFSTLAAVGLVAVFAGAANTPLACTIMAAELFGPRLTVFAALACYASYFFSGHPGIYHAQKIPGSTFKLPLPRAGRR